MNISKAGLLLLLDMDEFSMGLPWISPNMIQFVNPANLFGEERKGKSEMESIRSNVNH